MSDAGEPSYRVLSPRAKVDLGTLDQVVKLLETRPAATGDVVLRPHPLIVLVRRQALVVLITSAKVWDSSRDLLAPWTEKLATFEARLMLLGRPKDPDLERALNLGLCALLGPEPGSDELLLMSFTSLRLPRVDCRRLDSNQHVRGS